MEKAEVVDNEKREASSVKSLETPKRNNSNIVDTKCAICGDRASGLHYKVYSCDGCRGFFKRTVRSGIKDPCRHANLCKISKETRNSCKSCRFQKCLSEGMDKGAVQPKRSGRPKHKDKRTHSRRSSCDAATPEKRKTYGEQIVENNQNLLRLSNELNEDRCQQVLARYILENTGENNSIIAKEWSKIAKKCFYLVLKWVSELNTSKNVNWNERCILLEDNWPVIFILTVCQFYQCHDILKMISMLFFSVLHQNNGDNCHANVTTKPTAPNYSDLKSSGTYDITLILYRMREIIFQVQSMRCDSEEFSLMKIMALYYPSCDDLKFWGSAANSYKSAATSFVNYISHRSLPHDRITEVGNKISTFMMIIASIKGFNSRKLEMVFSPALELNQPIDRVFWNSIISNNFY